MPPFQIKICGVTSEADAIFACQQGADAIGLNFYDRSSRFVDLDTAHAIVGAIRDQNSGLAAETQLIGVFVNASVADMVRTAESLGLDFMQLHGDEEPSIVPALRQALGASKLKCSLIRAIRCKPAERDTSNEDNLNADDEKARVEALMLKWVKSGVDMVLLDASVTGEFGGTGQAVDWATVATIKCDVPLVLAGGLTPENVEEAISISKSKSVDVASGVESRPGAKDKKKVEAFVEAANSAFGRQSGFG